MEDMLALRLQTRARRPVVQDGRAHATLETSRDYVVDVTTATADTWTQLTVDEATDIVLWLEIGGTGNLDLRPMGDASTQSTRTIAAPAATLVHVNVGPGGIEYRRAETVTGRLAAALKVLSLLGG